MDQVGLTYQAPAFSAFSTTSTSALDAVEEGRMAQPNNNTNTTTQQQQQQQNSIELMFRSSAHPTILFFHLFFRTAAFLTYLLCGLFTSANFILIFVILTLLLAFDFWTVKNVSGRKLVGLRWWNDVDEHGQSRWIYESRSSSDTTTTTTTTPANTTQQVNATDYRVFWWSLYLTTLLWSILGLVAIIKFNFSWLILVLLALSMNTANLMGYTKCDKEAQKRVGMLRSVGGMGLSNGFGLMRLFGSGA